jgi:hypothetical protein
LVGVNVAIRSGFSMLNCHENKNGWDNDNTKDSGGGRFIFILPSILSFYLIKSGVVIIVVVSLNEGVCYATMPNWLSLGAHM